MPNIVFKSDLHSETFRLFYTASMTMSGWYKKKGFVVIPKNIKPGSSEEVILPNIDYLSIDGFWGELEKFSEDFDQIHNLDIFVVEGVGKALNYLELNVENWKKDWEKVESSFWKFVYAFFPDEINLLRDIEVYISRIGTISSYFMIGKNKDKPLRYFVRDDGNIGNLAEIILTDLLAYKKKEKRYRWVEIEAIVDFMMSRSILCDSFPHYQSTLYGISRVKGALYSRSEKYLKQIGLVYVDHDLELLGRKIYIHGRVVDKKLSRQEKELLYLLLKNYGELVTFDQVADALWGEGNFLSLYALNKAMQRLRKKLGKLGISESKLKTVRKRGYVLEG